MGDAENQEGDCQVVSRFQRSVLDGETAYERLKQKSNRKALVPVGERVMFMPMEKPKDKGKVRNRVGIMLGLLDRSDDVVIGTTERVVKARTVHRSEVMLGTRRASEACRGNPIRLRQLRASRWASPQLVLSVFRWFRSSTDRQFQSWRPRDYKALRFYIRREVELANYGFSDD